MRADPTPYNSELEGPGPGAGILGRNALGHMALNAEINQIVLYLGPAPLSQYDGHP